MITTHAERGAFALVHGILAILLLTACASSAYALDAATCAAREQAGLAAGVPPSGVLADLATLCYGISDDANPLTKEARAILDKAKEKDKPADIVKLASALRLLRTRIGEDATLYEPTAAREEFRVALERYEADVGRGVPAGTGFTSPLQWQLQNGDTLPTAPSLHLRSVVDEPCRADLAADACKLALDRGKAWLRAAVLVESTLTLYAAAPLDELRKRSELRLAMWHAYRDEALPQFPWEWILNSVLMKESRDKDTAGQPVGPQPVPTSQIIFLHPGVGLEWRDEPDDAPTSTDSNTQPIMYLEILGRNRWSWDETTGKMIGGAGVSLVATYADREADDDVGYGLIFHSRRTKAYTLGVTRSGDTTNFIVNADLAEFFKDRLAYWREAEEKIAAVRASPLLE